MVIIDDPAASGMHAYLDVWGEGEEGGGTVAQKKWLQVKIIIPVGILSPFPLLLLIIIFIIVVIGIVVMLPAESDATCCRFAFLCSAPTHGSHPFARVDVCLQALVLFTFQEFFPILYLCVREAEECDTAGFDSSLHHRHLLDVLAAVFSPT